MSVLVDLMECLLNRQTNRSSLNPILQIYGHVCQLLMTLSLIQVSLLFFFFFSLICFFYVKGGETTLLKQISTSRSSHSKIARISKHGFPITSLAICLLNRSFVVHSSIPLSITLHVLSHLCY